MKSKSSKTSTLDIQGTSVAVVTSPQGDYISLTDMLRAKDGDFFIADWLRNRNTVEFLGIWESIYNPAFNYGEFATIKSQAGSCEMVIMQMRSLLADHHIKRLAR